jgi:hypothetical protein
LANAGLRPSSPSDLRVPIVLNGLERLARIYRLGWLRRGGEFGVPADDQTMRGASLERPTSGVRSFGVQLVDRCGVSDVRAHLQCLGQQRAG